MNNITELFQSAATGILTILDDECKLLNPLAQNFVSNVYNANKTSQLLVQKNQSSTDTMFIVRHFICDVKYDSVRIYFF